MVITCSFYEKIQAIRIAIILIFVTFMTQGLCFMSQLDGPITLFTYINRDAN